MLNKKIFDYFFNCPRLLPFQILSVGKSELDFSFLVFGYRCVEAVKRRKVN